MRRMVVRTDAIGPLEGLVVEPAGSSAAALSLMAPKSESTLGQQLTLLPPAVVSSTIVARTLESRAPSLKSTRPVVLDAAGKNARGRCSLKLRPTSCTPFATARGQVSPGGRSRHGR